MKNHIDLKKLKDNVISDIYWQLKHLKITSKDAPFTKALLIDYISDRFLLIMHKCYGD